MRGNEFLDKMELIDPTYVEAADVKPKKERAWIRWGAMAACLGLIVFGTVAISMRNQEPNSNDYPYNDHEVLEYIGKSLGNIQTDAGEIVFNEIADIDAYRKFNTLYGYENKPYYSTRSTAYDLLTMYPAADESNRLHVTVFERDGSIKNCPGYNDFLELQEKAPIAADLTMRLLEKGNTVSAYYKGSIGAAGLSFAPAANCTATVVIGKDLSAIDRRLSDFLPILRQTLGTENSSYIGEQEISVHYFYQNRLYLGSKTEEAYQYYVYFERDGLQYLYQFSSNWSLPGQNISAMHNPPSTLHYVETQDECRKLFVEYLLTIAAAPQNTADSDP